ncbi:hypothetical protein QFZ67_002966 [Streptomyces sp. V1I1]|nr:hypothetical protein [Streptomyces sp. V1I1]
MSGLWPTGRVRPARHVAWSARHVPWPERHVPWSELGRDPLTAKACLRFWGTRTLVFGAEGTRTTWNG